MQFRELLQSKRTRSRSPIYSQLLFYDIYVANSSRDSLRCHKPQYERGNKLKFQCAHSNKDIIVVILCLFFLFGRNHCQLRKMASFRTEFSLLKSRSNKNGPDFVLKLVLHDRSCPVRLPLKTFQHEFYSS